MTSDTTQFWRDAAETFTLLLALFFLVPGIPSEAYPVDLFPAGLFAIAFFGVSRALRDKTLGKKWLLLGLELVGFAAIVFVANQVANILLQTNLG